MHTPRPYQETDIGRLRAAFKRKRSLLYVLPTGAGKTFTFVFIARGAAQRGKKILIIAHRCELIDQISGALAEAEVPHGFIAAGYPEKKHYPVQVASVQTLVRRLGKVDAPDLIIIDECHHSPSTTYREIIRRWPKSRLLGVTATPIHQACGGMGLIFDEMIVGPSIRELIAWGYLAKPKVYRPPLIDTSGLKAPQGKDYKPEDIRQLMESKKIIWGDMIAQYLKWVGGATALAFCYSVDAAEETAARFRKEGISAYALSGQTHPDIRRSVVRDFKVNKIQILASCDLFSEGFDVPNVHAGLGLRPTQSVIIHKQQNGRVLRTFPGKEFAIFLDFVNNTRNPKLGEPDAVCEWELDAMERDVNVSAHKTCPQCYCSLPKSAQTCPECGFEFGAAANEPRILDEHREGELIEASREFQQPPTQIDPLLLMPLWQMSLDQLIQYGKLKGYKPGWALHRYTARLQKQNAPKSA